MKKIKGFTLAEVLIALAIVGVLSAVMLPIANKFRPDPIKAQYCVTHDNLATVISVMVNDAKIYPTTGSDGKIKDAYVKFPLQNDAYVTLPSQGNVGGPTKFCKVLASFFSNVDSCSDATSYSDSSFNPMFKNNKGSTFMVVEPSTTYWQRDIYVDINGNKKPNCIYSSSSCKEPDRFKFSVLSDGNFAAQDMVGAGYLSKRTIWKKSDISTADVKILNGDYTIVEEDDDSSNLIAFSCTNYTAYGSCKGSEFKVADKDLEGKYNWNDAKKACEDIGMRLPTLSEMMSIAAAYNTTFKDLEKTEYWTGTMHSSGTKAQNVLIGSFNSGGSDDHYGFGPAKGTASLSTQNKVRCVTD